MKGQAMSGDKASEATSADAPDRERLRAIPVVDLRPVLGGAEEEKAAPEPAPSTPLAPSTPALVPKDELPPPPAPKGGGWLLPFMAGVLLGAGGFYAALWALALI